MPPAPDFSVDRLVTFDVSSSGSLRYGVDPATIKITPDGIVRYVMVASSAGATTALYEGIRCATSEYKTYARRSAGGAWRVSQNVEWKTYRGGANAMHTYSLAKQGICTGGNAPQSSVDRMVRTLENSLNESKN